MAEVQRDIVIKQSQGRTSSGEIVYFEQDEIFLNGMRVGYIGHHDSTACMIRPTDQGTKDAISEAIAKHRGKAPDKYLTAPVIEDDDTEEDDE